MRKLIIRCTVAFVTFSMGVIIATVLRIAIPHDSNRPAVQTQPREVKTAATDTRVTQHADLYIVAEISEPDPNPSTWRRLSVKLAKHGATVIDLNLGESVYNQEVTLNFRENNEYRMLQRYRTSMSISAEGPHLDLLDWRHFDSPWVSLKALSSKRFRMLAANQMEGSNFPWTANEEIVEEVRKRVGTDWPEVLELAKGCGGPNEGACLVSISSIYLRIQKRVRVGWIDVGLIEFRLPMGC